MIFINAKTRKEALAQVVYSKYLVKVQNGYKCFEDYFEYLACVNYKPKKSHIVSEKILLKKYEEKFGRIN